MLQSPLGYRNYSEPMKYMIHSERTALLALPEDGGSLTDKWSDLFWRIENDPSYGQEKA